MKTQEPQILHLAEPLETLPTFVLAYLYRVTQGEERDEIYRTLRRLRAAREKPQAPKPVTLHGHQPQRIHP